MRACFSLSMLGLASCAALPAPAQVERVEAVESAVPITFRPMQVSGEATTEGVFAVEHHAQLRALGVELRDPKTGRRPSLVRETAVVVTSRTPVTAHVAGVFERDGEVFVHIEDVQGGMGCPTIDPPQKQPTAFGVTIPRTNRPIRFVETTTRIPSCLPPEIRCSLVGDETGFYSGAGVTWARPGDTVRCHADVQEHHMATSLTWHGNEDLAASGDEASFEVPEDGLGVVLVTETESGRAHSSEWNVGTEQPILRATVTGRDRDLPNIELSVEHTSADGETTRCGTTPPGELCVFNHGHMLSTEVWVSPADEVRFSVSREPALATHEVQLEVSGVLGLVRETKVLEAGLATTTIAIRIPPLPRLEPSGDGS